MISDVNKLQFIDVLRGVAILMVIATHVGVSFKPDFILLKVLSGYGHLGVQLFFMVSAYTLCISRIKRNEAYTPYFWRRVFRIFPLYFFGVILYSIIYFLENKFLSLNYLYSVIANIFLIHGLIPPFHNNVVPGGWSIGTEMVFYLIFPCFFYLANKNVKAFFFTTLIITIMSFFLYRNFMPVEAHANFLYHSIFIQLPVFASGIIIYKFDIKVKKVISILGFIIFTLANLYNLEYGENYYILVKTLLTSISMGFLLLFVKELDWSNFELLQEIGRRSYSIYIIHFLFTKYLFPKLDLNISSSNDISYIFYFMVVSFLTFKLSYFTKKYIEDYFIRKGNLLIKKHYYLN